MTSCKAPQTDQIQDLNQTHEDKSTKKRKLDDTMSMTVDVSEELGNSVFRDLKIIKVLREDTRHKVINLHASVDGGNPSTSEAVVLLERKPFDIPTLQRCLQQTKTKETLKNDIYSTHDVYSTGLSSDMKATLIHPATEKHIAKYATHEPFIVHETPELYHSVTLPCLEQSKFSIQWVYNILEKKTESDRIVVEDADPENGFIMVPDMKWDRKTTESLYLVAIVHKHGIRSIRDLRKVHIPLLENIMTKGQAAIKEKFQVDSEKLRIYFHYQPSYYHLHVHFTHIKFDAPGTDALRAHLLVDVLDNLRLDPDFYSKKTLSYVVRENEELYKKFQESKYFS